MYVVETKPIGDRTITVPGSKSYTHRILIASALSDGICRIDNPLRSDDTLLTASGLRRMGVSIQDNTDHMIVDGTSGHLTAGSEPIDLGSSGTSVRLLTGVCALGTGIYTITGTRRMQARPIQDLLDGLAQLGIEARSIRGTGCPPIEIAGGEIAGGKVNLDCHVSSQYLSAILLMAPFSREGIDLTVVRGPVSKPYVDMTVEVMQRLGVSVNREGYERFHVPGRQVYQAGHYRVEPDASQAGYFWAAAAVTGAVITASGLSSDSRQGDVRFAHVLGRMGCRVSETPDGIQVAGGALSGIDVDMADMPDMVPTLAVVAAFANGTTRIRNVGHLKAKESDRLGSVVAELLKMGVDASCSDTGMTVTGGNVSGARIETYDDHRLAMSFSVAGLKVPGVEILDEGCVAKSFPNFWQVFESLYV
ncbi:MAG: 3-phosphoshikimate 1-carboxyvinyltransferase [Deltaproteobacteria bacterium]|nr:3-phosphoshikimate 1-carboxyvinyltransferase [Deltaproteobacteria bacterium]